MATADRLDRARELLSSEEVEDVLLAALLGEQDGEQGRRPPGFAVHRTGLHARTGVDVTGLYRVHYAVDAGSAPVTDHLVITTAEVDGPGLATLTQGDLTFRVWRHPGDPRLADLPAAYDPRVVSEWVGAPVRELLTMSYRPLRRAVLLAAASDAHYFLKVAPPRRVAAIDARQRLLADAGVAPAVIGQPRPGVIISAAADGLPLAEHLSELRADLAVPDPSALVDLLDAIPSDAARLPARPSWSDRLDFHVAAARDVMGDGDLLRGIAADLRRIIDAAPTGPVVAVHGDYYEANVFVRDGRPAMFIDIDSVGPGHRVDDLACVLAHLAVLPTLAPRHYATGVPQVLETWRTDFERRVDPAALRARTACVILSLVPGAARGMQPDWLGLVSDWRDAAVAAL